MNWKTYKIILILAALLPVAVLAEKNIHDAQSTYEEWVKNNTFPFRSRSERKEKIFNNYSGLKLGLRKSEVEGLIGKPDFSQPMARKGPGQGYIGSSWSYYLENPDLILRI